MRKRKKAKKPPEVTVLPPSTYRPQYTVGNPRGHLFSPGCYRTMSSGGAP